MSAEGAVIGLFVALGLSSLGWALYWWEEGPTWVLVHHMILIVASGVGVMLVLGPGLE